MLDRFKYAFFVDGSLRDVYVFHTTMDDWRKLFAELHNGGYDLDFEMGEVRELPADPDDIVERYSRKGVPLTEPCARLRVRIGANSLHFYFHSVDPIEFDLNPKDVTSEQSLDALFGFMRSRSYDAIRSASGPTRTQARPLAAMEANNAQTGKR